MLCNRRCIVVGELPAVCNCNEIVFKCPSQRQDGFVAEYCILCDKNDNIARYFMQGIIARFAVVEFRRGNDFCIKACFLVGSLKILLNICNCKKPG